MSKFRDGMAGPTVILLAICLVITFALAATQVSTAEAIKASEERAAVETRALVLESGAADGFTEMEGLELPEGVFEVYKANNDSGYVFKAGAKGYDGLVTFMVGVDPEGKYVGINMFDHNETPGLGSKIGAIEYLEQYHGLMDPESVDSITGATRTSNALKNTLRLVQEAFQQVKGA